jgi:hypothetical protein
MDADINSSRAAVQSKGSNKVMTHFHPRKKEVQELNWLD